MRRDRSSHRPLPRIRSARRGFQNVPPCRGWLYHDLLRRRCSAV